MEIEDNVRRSDEVQDIIGQMPSWLIRWGAVIVFGIFLILILASILIKYPDTLSGDLMITSNNPPIHLVSQAEGRVKLLVKDNSPVTKNKYIAYIENTIPLDEIIQLKEDQHRYERMSKNPYQLLSDSLLLRDYSNLGQLQEVYNDFKLACDEYRLFVQLDENQKKAEALKVQLYLITQHKDVLENKKSVYLREHEIAERQHQVDRSLYEEKALSLIEVEKSEEKSIGVLEKKHALSEELIKIDQETAHIKATINELERDSKDKTSKMKFRISQSYKSLKANFELWEKKYVIKSPFEGKVSFYNFWTNDQYVKSGEDLAYVISESDSVFARLQVKGKRLGKAQVGQKVRILLDSYESVEYGLIYGTVKSISLVNTENLYTVKVTLNDGLKTTYGKTIKFMPEMRGKGDIITKDMSIIERCLYRLLENFSKN